MSATPVSMGPRAPGRWLVVALSFALSACDLVTSPEGNLERQRAKWARARPEAYSMTVKRTCECLREMTGPVRVRVAGDHIGSRTYVGSDQTVEPPYEGLFPDVEGLFAIVEEAHAVGAARLDVEYDRVLGYPRTVRIDYDVRHVDDEITITVTDFAREL